MIITGPVFLIQLPVLMTVSGLQNQRCWSKDKDGRPDVMNTLSVLAKQGMTSVLIEAGGTLLSIINASGLVDRLIWIKAPMIIGGDGYPADC